MVNWNLLLQKYMIGFSDIIADCTRPLKDQLGIPFFGYHSIDHTGKYATLANHPAWAEHYLQEEYYRDDPFLRHPAKYTSGVSFFSSIMLNATGDAWRKITGAGDGIVLIDRNPQGVEFSIFAGDRDNNNFIKLCLNHAPLLRTFSDHFKKEMQHILCKQAEEGSLLTISKIGDSMPTIDPKIQVSMHRQFLSSLGFKAACQQAQSLTSRENDCLQSLLKGISSIKGIASALDISPRTVEYYLENVKNKLDCWTKEDLAIKATLFQTLGLL